MPPRAHDLVAENERLREANEALRHEVAVLSAKIAELEVRLALSSRNSSLPPSQGSPKSRAERRAHQREAAKAARGEPTRPPASSPGRRESTS